MDVRGGGFLGKVSLSTWVPYEAGIGYCRAVDLSAERGMTKEGLPAAPMGYHGRSSAVAGPVIWGLSERMSSFLVSTMVHK